MKLVHNKEVGATKKICVLYIVRQGDSIWHVGNRRKVRMRP